MRDLGRAFLGARLVQGLSVRAVAHPVLDAVLSIRDTTASPQNRSKRFTWFGTPRLRIMAEPKEAKQNPRTHVEAEFSIPWGVACVLVDAAAFALTLRAAGTER
jgi:hypothetical protein